MFSKGRLLPTFLLVSIASFCLSGCNKESDNIFTATTQNYESPKLHFNGSNITYWDNGDEVLINGNSYTISIDGSDNNKARIVANNVTPIGGNYYAAFPADRANMSSNTTTFELPYSEKYETVSSGNQLINNLMVAKSSGSTLAFQNVAAMLHFRIKGTGSGEGKKLMAIEVSCDKPLVGNLTVNCDDLTTSFSGTATDTARMLTFTTPYTITLVEKDFYILIPPVENASHFRVSYVIEDGNTVKVFEKTKVATISFTKNNIYHFGDDNYTGSKMYFQGTLEVSPLAMDGTASNPYLVSSETTWNAIKSNLGYANKYITLVNDITVATTVSSLKATLNGNGHTITLSNNKSLFQTIEGGVVRNLTVAGNITSPTCYNYKYGALACMASDNAVIENCVNKANITCMQGRQTSTSTMVGGLCGQLGLGCSISNCRNEGDINSDARYIGGVVGYCNGVTKAQNCVNNNNLTITLANNERNEVFIGGIFGQLTISSTSGEHAATECHNNGAITINGTTEKTINCGGCFGVITSSANYEVSNCSNTAAIKYNTAASGSCYFGGIVGNNGNGNGNSTMINCYNEGSITTISGVYAGGLLGNNRRMSILNCYAYCDISAKTAAGIVADGSSLMENTTISHCYYYDTITAQNAYGIAGHSNYSGGTNFNMTLDHCCYPVSNNICASTTNYDAPTCTTMSSASDNGALTLLNTDQPAGARSWVISGDHIVFGQ